MIADNTIAELLKLTRGGRLGEATALIQKGLGKAASRLRPGDAPARGAAFRRPSWAKTAAASGRRQAETAPAASTPGSFEWRVVANDAGTRRFKLYLPTTFEGKALPLVVMLHGCTQSPDDFAAGTRMNEIAEDLGLIVMYPEQPRRANNGKCWNWFKPGDQKRNEGEPSLIADAVRQVMRDLPVDRSRVFAAGLSAGGAAASILGRTYPDLFAGVGVHSGLACGAAHDLASALSAMRDGAPGRDSRGERFVPTIVFHGSGDRTVSPANAAHVLRSAVRGFAAPVSEQGTSPGGTRYTRTIYRDGDGRIAAEQWMLAGAGHAWSGGSTAGSYTDPLGPDAGRAMMRFFLGLQGRGD